MNAATQNRAAHSSFVRNPLRPLIEKMAARIAQEYRPEQIVLYGSQATGKARPDSDIDLFIVKQTSENPFSRKLLVSDLVNDLNKNNSIQPLVLTPEEVVKRLERGDQFIQQILTRGIQLYCDPNHQFDWGALDMAKNAKDLLYPFDWLRMAEKDWKRAAKRLDEGDYEDAAFRLQQALEKYLKAFLLRQGWELEKTHDTKKLLREAVKYKSELKNFENLCERVEKYYLEERYPFETHETGVTFENVARARQEAQALREIILKPFIAPAGTEGGQEKGDES